MMFYFTMICLTWLVPSICCFCQPNLFLVGWYPPYDVVLFQTDLFGLVGTVHVLLFKKYMQIYQSHEEWKITSSFMRYVIVIVNVKLQFRKSDWLSLLKNSSSYRAPYDSLWIFHFQ